MGDAVLGLVAQLLLGRAPSQAPQLRQVFAKDIVAVVRDGQKLVALVTKSDLIAFLAER